MDAFLNITIKNCYWLYPIKQRKTPSFDGVLLYFIVIILDRYIILTIQVQRFDFVISVVVFGWFYIAVYSFFLQKFSVAELLKKQTKTSVMLKNGWIFRLFFDFCNNKQPTRVGSPFFQLSWGFYIFFATKYLSVWSRLYIDEMYLSFAKSFWSALSS